MMRSLILLFAIYLLSGCDSDSNKNITVSERDFNQAKLAFAELEDALKNDNGKLWNHKLNGPILLVNRDSRIVIANEKDRLDELQKYRSFYSGRFPEKMNIANGNTEWNGKLWVIVGLPMPELREERMRLLIHELFHRIQPEIGFDSLSTVENVHLDTKDGRILLKLEMEALKRALQSNEPQVYLKDALLFRNYRHKIFPGSVNAEIHWRSGRVSQNIPVLFYVV
jgi:hypothetical protein